MTNEITYAANMVAEAIGHLKIARAALRHAARAESPMNDIISRVTEYDEREMHADGDEHDIPDNEADAMTLASAGMGTDEDYGYYGGEEG